MATYARAYAGFAICDVDVDREGTPRKYRLSGKKDFWPLDTQNCLALEAHSKNDRRGAENLQYKLHDSTMKTTSSHPPLTLTRKT